MKKFPCIRCHKYLVVSKDKLCWMCRRLLRFIKDKPMNGVTKYSDRYINGVYQFDKQTVK